ncbi:MAG: hypothetical protein ACOX0Z_02575 [Candidatus Nanosyncoccaceae bacterium]|jgi:hypothetical protein
MARIKKVLFAISAFFVFLGIILLVRDAPARAEIAALNMCERMYKNLGREYTSEWLKCAADAVERADNSRKQFCLYIVIGSVVAIITGNGLTKNKDMD